jgi:cytochrome c
MRNVTMTCWLVGTLTALAVGATLGPWAYLASEHRDLARRAGAMTGGDPEHGRALAKAKGCAGCHDIPGVNGANGSVGPALSAFSHRVYIAGVLSNTPAHLHQWLLDPPAIDSKTAMPNVGLSDPEANDIAAFLYTLE